MKTFKFKLYRSKKTRRLDHQLWVACKVYNHAIARANRKLSSKRMRSHNREKARLELARLHRRVANQRRAFHWELARELCKEYSVI